MRFLVFTFSLIFFMSCDKTTNKEKKDSKKIIREIMVAAKNCALITTDTTGVAHARTMDPFLPEEDFTVWFGTNPKSLKVKQIKQNKKVTLYYFDAKSIGYVTLQGNAEIVNSPNEKEKFWKKEWKNFYKNRTKDYLLIKFTPRIANIISEKYNILGDTISWETPQLNFKK